MKLSIFRKAHFNAAHRLHVPSWSDEKNQAVFGPCNNPHFHGHNYELIVKVTGELDPLTGMVIDMKYLSNLIKTHVESRYDHRNLNIELPEFQDLNPTAENICIEIWKILRKHLSPDLDLRVRLYETPRNFVEYPA